MKNNKEKFENLIEKACELCNKNEYKEYKKTEKSKRKNLLHKFYNSNKYFTNLLLKMLV